MRGVVKMVNQEKGWGWIKPAAGETHPLLQTGQDVFFHRSAVRGQPFEFVREEQEVECEIGPGREGKGPRAEQVFLT